DDVHDLHFACFHDCFSLFGCDFTKRTERATVARSRGLPRSPVPSRQIASGVPAHSNATRSAFWSRVRAPLRRALHGLSVVRRGLATGARHSSSVFDYTGGP